MNVPKPHIYEFDGFRLDAVRRLLLQHGKPVPLKPRVFDTLLYLARNHGRVIEKDELMRAIWPDTIVEENNLNQNVSTLRRVLGESRGENRYIVTVPGRGYQFAPSVDAITGEDLGGEVTLYEIPASHQPPPSARWKRVAVPILIGSFLCVALVAGMLRRTRTQTVVLPPVTTIAVLPFKPLVTDMRDEAIEVGMSDTLIAKLGKIRNLTVRPLTAVRKYAGQDQDPFEAGRELRVEAVLDGNVQRLGARIRVSARLVRVSNQQQLWAGQFDEEATDIFRVQDSISDKVARELSLELTREERELVAKHYTSDPQAYEFYLKGRFFWSQSKRESIDKAIGFFREAIRKDPNYALAYSGLADCYRILPVTSDVPSREAFPKAKEAALRALEIDGGLAEAHTVLGWIHLWYGWDWAGAEDKFRHALALDPNYAHARIGYAHLLSDLGRNVEAVQEADRVLSLDPISVYAGTLKGHFLYQARQYPEAIHHLRRTLELAPGYWIGQITLGKSYERAGRYQDALEAFQKAKESAGGSSEPISLIGHTYAVAGRRREAERELRELEAIAQRRYVPPHYMALIHHGLGNSTEALNWLERAYQDRDVHMVFLGVDAKWDQLRGDPRFISLIGRMNLSR